MLVSVGARVGSMLAVCLAAGVVVHGRPLTPFDASLPIIAAALSAIAWIVRTPSLDLAPLGLIVAAIAIPNDSVRLLAYGGVIAIAFATAVILGSREGSLDRIEAISLALTVAVIFRLVPFEGRRFVPELVIFIGCAALLLASSFRRRVSLGAFAAALLVTILTPADPSRAAVLPLLLAASCWLLRGGGLLAAIAAIPLAIAAGRWAVPIVAAAAAMRLIEKRGAPAFTRWLIATALVAVGVMIRPALAPLYLASGLLFCLNRRQSSPVSAPLIAYLAIGALLAAWSGMLLPAFPLPVTPLQLVIIGAILLTTSLPDGRWSALPLAALFIFAISSFQPRVPARHPIDVALAAGEAIDIPTGGANVADLVVSGAHISHFQPDTVVGTIEVLTERGSGFQRVIRVGEVADWGAFRQGHRFRTRNRLPIHVAAIHGVGANAYPSGAGVMTLASKEKIASIRVTAERSLPPNARLQVESFEAR